MESLCNRPTPLISEFCQTVDRLACLRPTYNPAFHYQTINVNDKHLWCLAHRQFGSRLARQGLRRDRDPVPVGFESDEPFAVVQETVRDCAWVTAGRRMAQSPSPGLRGLNPLLVDISKTGT